ncbi:NUDIX domain-containing protein [Brachybacterium sp. GPGPB12]|uniref:NUDIX domain-containing protein n=1 Tax=Brachybacterium sp. GPGPB12 TaxID=3023517 RepID=UPI0031343758
MTRTPPIVDACPPRPRASAPAIHVAVDLIVLTLRDGALSVSLIQRHDEPHKGAWALPGGFIEYGEDLDGAAYRVLSDEASLGERRRAPRAGAHVRHPGP